jgi:hypothetical protein
VQRNRQDGNGLEGSEMTKQKTRTKEPINWIDVSDELPDSGTEVLVCFERNDCEERDTCIAEYDDSRNDIGPWFVDGGQTHFGFVMFWAEKPEGPKR